MSDMMATRIAPLAAFAGAPVIGGVSLRPVEPKARFILRGKDAAAHAAAQAFGVAIPRTPNRAEANDGRAALWLGPDEWLLLAPPEEAGVIAETLATALSSLPHSLVDVSHRQTGIQLSGTAAANVLNAAVPLDLCADAFPVGMATRTIFEKAEIVLWRTALDTFHIEVWRSFSSYVWAMLDAVRREEAALM